MRILTLLSHYPRWSETFVRQDIALLREAGADLKLASLFQGDCPMEPDWPEAMMLSSSRESGFALSTARAFPGHRLLPAWLREGLSLFRHRRLLQRVEETCRSQGIECIYGEFADLAGLLACLAAKHLGIPFLLGLHARDVHTFKFTERLFREASAILVCNSAAHLAFLEKHPFAAPKTHLLPHGIDLSQWEFRPREDASGQKLLFVGRLVPKKGVALLLEALKQLPTCELEVVGTGPLEESLRQQAAGLPVRWTGRLSREEVRQKMREASLLVVSSVVAPDGDRDGVPNVVLEAMACGLPVVGTQAGSLPELLTEKTGWPVSDPTPDALASAIRTALSSQEEARHRCTAARSLIEKCYDAQALARQRLDIIGSCLDI